MLQQCDINPEWAEDVIDKVNNYFEKFGVDFEVRILFDSHLSKDESKLEFHLSIDITCCCSRQKNDAPSFRRYSPRQSKPTWMINTLWKESGMWWSATPFPSTCSAIRYLHLLIA